MNLVAIDDVSMAFGVKNLLDHISFGIDEGEKIAVLGINGSGKSTLLKLVAGLLEPDGGAIIRSRHLRIQYLPQEPVFEPDATVLEAVLQGKAEQLAIDLTSQAQAKAMLTRLGLNDFNASMGALSGGQRKRAALAAALMRPADLLILDEPTNHLDNASIDWLEAYLQRFRGAVLMVTHDRYFLERVSSRIIEIEQARLYSYPGNYSDYLARKLQRIQIEASMAEKSQALLRKELAWIRKGARARSTKQKARIERFEQLQDHQPGRPEGKLEISSAASRLGRKTVVLQEVSYGFGNETLICDYSCIVSRNERLGLVGPNGIGKSTLLRIFSGELLPDQGTVEIGGTVKIGYFPQESTGLPEDMRVIDYIRQAGEYLQAGKKLLSASQMLETFLFTPAAQWTTLQKLSGGEKRRLHLLRILMEAPNVLLLDEPGNDLDIETLAILEDYLDDFPGAVIAVSHDRYFLDRICHKILAFENHGILREYPGNYSDYLAAASAADIPSTDPKPQAPRERKSEDRRTPLKFSFKEQREFDEIEDRIAAVETELKVINASIEQAASDYQRLEQLLVQRQDIVARVDYLLERWTYLNERAEAIQKERKS